MPMSNLSKADLSAANLSEADLTLANLTGANLFLTKLPGAILKDINLTDARWWRAKGLTPDQIKLFMEKFPPSEKTDEKWRIDYQKWIRAQDIGKGE